MAKKAEYVPFNNYRPCITLFLAIKPTKWTCCCLPSYGTMGKCKEVAGIPEPLLTALFYKLGVLELKNLFVPRASATYLRRQPWKHIQENPRGKVGVTALVKKRLTIEAERLSSVEKDASQYGWDDDQSNGEVWQISPKICRCCRSWRGYITRIQWPIKQNVRMLTEWIKKTCIKYLLRSCSSIIWQLDRSRTWRSMSWTRLKNAAFL